MKKPKSYLSQITWYRRDGKPYSVWKTKVGSDAWMKQMEEVENDLKNNKIVKQTTLWWGGWVSTVWLGIDHSFYFSPNHTPIIFETMLFKPWWINRWDDLDMDRYATEEQAKAGHEAMVKKWSNPISIVKNILKR